MKNILFSALTFFITAGTALAWSEKVALTGAACMGENYETLIEGLTDRCKPGDIIATKNPMYFCDFHYSMTTNSANSTVCVYSGLKPERTNNMKKPGEK